MRVLDSSFCADFLRGRDHAKEYRLNHREKSFVLPAVGFTRRCKASASGSSPEAVHKRIGNWLNLLQFGFIALISAPVLDAPWTRFLPLAHGSALLQRAMVDGVRLWVFGFGELGLLVAVALGYLLGSYVVFHYATKRARRLGVLGDY